MQRREPSDLRQVKIATKAKFERAIILYYRGDFSKAARLFQECVKYDEGDRAARIYLDRCQCQGAEDSMLKGQ